MTAGANGAARDDDPVVELCAFRVGDEEYVIDVRRVREIVQPLAIVAVPQAPEWMEGVASLRGAVLPVLDVRRRLGLPVRPPTRRTKFLIVVVERRVIALVVDGVSEVVRIPRSAIGPPPEMGPAAARLFVGVCGARSGGAVGDHLAPRPGGPARSPSTQRLRLLLNVKALLDAGRGPGAPDDGGAPDPEVA